MKLRRAPSMLSHKKRLPEWRTVTRLYLQQRGSLLGMAWHMAKALWSGPVPRSVWRQRILRHCNGCPCFDREARQHPDGRKWRLNACAGPHGSGCGCWVPAVALSANPSGNGCWLRSVDATEGGWPAYRFPSFWARILAPFRFLCGR